MKTLMPAWFLAALLVQGCNLHVSFDGQQVKGSGVMQTETREVDLFEGVKLQMSADVQVKRGDQPKLTITADDNLLPIITSEVEDGILILGASSGFSTSRKIRIELEAPVLREFQIHGSGDVFLDSVTDDRVTLKISGSGDLEAVGTVSSLQAGISGSGDMDLGELKAEQAEVTINGSGNVKLFAARSLDARINGSGDIAYAGDPPDVRTRINGSGKISRR